MTSFDPLVSTDWLADHLGAPDLKVIDGSWRMPGDGSAIDHYNSEHIASAVFFDLDVIADTQSGLPHMLPPRRCFEQAIGTMGITQSDHVIVYDEKGIFSAARVWWTFRAMGHQRVAVLDGGLPKWLTESRQVTADQSAISPAAYKASPCPADWRQSADDIRVALAGAHSTVIDARPAPRFAGEAPEPRAGLRSGHMPGAVNIPFPAMIAEDGTLRSSRELRHIFAAVGVDLSQPIITSCGSGVTAAILSLALEVSGIRPHGLYDGSWAEWGDEGNDDAAFPVESGSGSPG